MTSRPRNIIRRGFWVAGAPAFALAGRLAAGEVEAAKLPPPGTNRVDFARDIQPLFETSCWRCHGPERPKGGFRLTSRAAAIQGGERGPAIVPGRSADSPLIQYVARLVPDLEMPPAGKGAALTVDQVALLRAWIDQGAVWATNRFVSEGWSFGEPTLGFTTVRGNQSKFREQTGQPAGLNGGVSQFEWRRQLDEATKLTLAGHATRDDYQADFRWERRDVGFLHTGWEQYRKYFADTGGFFPAASPPAPRLGEEPGLNLGKAWLELGLTLPDWPRMVLGYAYVYKRGVETTTQWNNLDPGSIPAAPAIGPGSRELREGTHVITFSLEKELSGGRMEDNFRGEFYHLDTHQTNAAFAPNFGGGMAGDERQNYHYFQGANTLVVERQFNDWLFASGGYLYSQLDANSGYAFDGTGATLNQQIQVPRITLERESNVGNLNGRLGPFEGVTIAGGVQTEWTHEQGNGAGNFDLIFAGPFVFANPATWQMNYDTAQVQESVGLSYAKIPFTSLFADLRLQQASTHQNGSLANQIGDAEEFAQRTTASSRLTDYRLGFTTSPEGGFTIGGHYRRYENDTRYPAVLNEQPIGTPAIGYPGFILGRDLVTDEVEGRLGWHPWSWLKTALTCQFLTTDYRAETRSASDGGAPGDISPGGRLLAGESVARNFSLNTTIAPGPRLFLTSTVSIEPTRTTTANNGTAGVAPYRGTVYSLISSANYAWRTNVSWFAVHSFSEANFGQDNFAGGLPVGIQYQQHALQVGVVRRWGQGVTTKLQYGYFRYTEPSGGGAANYVANSVFASIAFPLP